MDSSSSLLFSWSMWMWILDSGLWIGGREEDSLFVLHGIKCQLVSNLLQGLIYELNF